MQGSASGLVAASEAIAAIAQQTNAAAESMTGSAEEVANAVESIAAISEENSAGAEEVSAATEEMSAQAEQVVASASILADMASQLEGLAGGFQDRRRRHPGRHAANNGRAGHAAVSPRGVNRHGQSLPGRQAATYPDGSIRSDPVMVRQAQWHCLPCRPMRPHKAARERLCGCGRSSDPSWLN